MFDNFFKLLFGDRGNNGNRNSLFNINFRNRNNNNAELKAQSQPICTITEGVDVEITLRMWVEGMDKDCMHDIAADKMIGQIQFISKEVTP